jgi:hypothetical protein
MRHIFILLISCLLYSCNLNQSNRTYSNLIVGNDSVIDTGKMAKMRLTNANEYSKVLDLLDQGDLASLDLAGMLFKNCEADTATRDSMFVVYSDFFNNLAANYLENNESVSDQLANSPSSEAISKLKANLLSYGILLRPSEGTFYLEPLTEYLFRNFGDGLSQAYREYLAIASREQHAQFAEDGSILIPTDSLISRIIAWEKFMTRYPDFISNKIVHDQYTQYLGAFLAGMDNSRVFDPETNRLKDSIKISFESFVSKNPESKSAGVVKSYLELLLSTNFNYTDKVDSFLLEKVYY